MLSTVRALVLPQRLERGSDRAWIVDDTAIPKKSAIRSVWRASTID